VVLRVKDLPALVTGLESKECVFATRWKSVLAGKQIQVEDPDGNRSSLFEPAEKSRP